MKLSIALCTFNGERYLAEQLESYAKQTRLPEEVVVCDDGSNDRTLSIVESFARSVPFPVRLYRNPSNLGPVRNFEKSVALCEGDIISFSDQDDVWYPRKLERVEKAFLECPRAGALFSDADLVDEKLRPLRRTVWQQRRFNSRLQNMVIGGRSPEVMLRANRAWLGMSVAFRSEYRTCLLPFPRIGQDKWAGHDDWTMMLIAFVADITLIAESLVQYRQHAGNLSGIRVTALGDRLTSAILKERRTTRERSYLKRIAIYEALRDRLIKLDWVPDLGHKLRMLDQKIEHLRRRASMPDQRFYRVPYIIRECINMGYHRYSEGFLDMLRDLAEKDRRC